MEHESKQFSYLEQLGSDLRAGRDPLPRCIEIHPTDICNHRCGYCFHGGVGFDPTRVSETLTIDDYEHIFDQMARLQIDSLSIAGGGEPLADVRFGGILEQAHKRNLSVRLVTHGNFLFPNLDIHVLKCRELRVSIDAIRPETYELIRRVSGQKLHNTLAHIERLLIKRDAEAAPLSIGVTFLVNRDNYQETVLFCHALLKFQIDALVIKHDIYGVNALTSVEWDHLLTGLSEIDDRRLDIRKPMTNDAKGNPCIIPSFQIVCNPYGDVYSCPLGSQPGETNGYLLGNLRNQSLLEVWDQSAPLREKIRQHGVHCAFCNSTDLALNRAYREL